MIEFIRGEKWLIIAIMSWFFASLFSDFAAMVAVGISLILFAYRKQYFEILAGLFVLLVLSDNYYLGFAKTIKPVATLFAGLLVLMNGRAFLPLNRLFQPFIFFFLLSGVLAFRHPDIFISAQKTVSYFLLLLVVPNLIMYIFRQRGEEVFRGLIYTGVLVLVAGFVYAAVNPDFAFVSGRYRGIFGNPNGVGIFSVLFFMLSVVVFSRFTGLFSRNERIFIYAVIIISAVMSGSRNTLAAIIIFLIFIRLQKISPYLSFIILILITVTYETLLTRALEGIASAGLGESLRLETVESISGRVVAWNFAWDHIQKNLFFGLGFGYDEYLFFLPKVKFKLNMAGHEGGVHNSYLGLLLNTGIAGLALFTAAFAITFTRAVKASRIALPVLFTVLFLSNFESWLIGSLNPFTIQLVSILTILGYCTRKTAVIPAPEGDAQPLPGHL